VGLVSVGLLMVNVESFGMNRLLIVLILGLMVFGLVSAGEKVSVVILEDDVEQVEGFSVSSDDVEMEVTHEFSSVDGFVAEIDVEDLGKVKAKFGDDVFVEERRFGVMLDVSVPNIGGSDSWILQSEGVNLSGAGQTVCVIDTGVNYNHVALGGCYGDNDPDSSCRVLGGYDYIGDDDDPMDDHGHGTHVAGIVASNDSTYSGVAPDSKIIAMKVLDSSGFSESNADVLAAIDWCVANASRFNISVISMSLGDDGTYNSYCDGLSASWSSMINSAVSAGIPVVISSGNCDSGNQTCTDGVSFPACIENATRVGAVNDSDVLFYMRGALFQLMAPGRSIISSILAGGFGSRSGTSMAAPHIAGSFALMKQYVNLSSQVKSVDELESALNDSGVRLDDSSESGYNFTRINVKEALLSLDGDAADVALVFPVNNHVNLSVNYSFVCSAEDWQLSNLTFRIWNSSGVYYNSTNNLTGTSNESSFDLTDMPLGEYEWNCFVSDALGNLGSASSNSSLTIGYIEVSLNSPVNASYTGVNESEFNCSSRADASYELVNVTFRLWNSSGVLMKNETRNISGFDNSTIFNYTFLSDDVYLWDCVGVNNNSDEGDGVNYSVTYDSVVPSLNLTSLPSSETSSSVSKSFGFNVTDDNIANCSLVVNGVVSLTNSSVNVSLGQSFSQTFTPGTYVWNVNCSDLAGNVNASGENSFVITAPSSGSGGSSGGGGGGGGSSVKVVDVNEWEFWIGKSESLGAGDKMNFNLTSGNHSLEVKKVGNNSVDLVVMSDPVSLTLGIGEEVKLNLSSPDYYDLVVGLNGVLYGKANVSVKRIFSPIRDDSAEPDEVAEEERVFRITEDEEGFELVWVWVGLVVLGLIIGVFLNRKKVKGKDIKKKNGKQNKKVKTKAKRKR